MVFAGKIIKLQKKREEIAKKIKSFVNKFIGDVDEIYKKFINQDKEIEDDIIDEKDIFIKKSNKRKNHKRIIEEINRFYINFN